MRLSRVANPFGLGMRRSIRDVGVFRPRDSRGQIQGRIFGVLGGTCSCGGLVSQVPVNYRLNFGLSYVWMVQLG